MKRIKALLLSAVMIFTMTGCLPHTELDEQAIVEAIGIDFSEGKYEVTVQYFNMEGSGGNTPTDASKANIINVSGKGATVSTALEGASVKCGKNFMYGITALIVIGREALSEDILKTLSFIESFYQSNPNLLVAAAEKASDIMNVKFKEGVISVEKLKMLLNNAQYHGLGENIKVLELLSEQRRPYAATALPLLAAVNTGSDTTDDGKTVELAGGCLISNKAYTGDLSLSDLSGLQLLSEKPKNTTVSADMGNERVEVTLYNIGREISYDYDGGRLSFEIEISADGKYTDSQLKNKDASFGYAVEDVCGAIIKERIGAALENTVLKYGCDPCGLKYYISSSDYGEWKQIEELFGELLMNADFEITCDIDIDRFGISH